MHKEAYEFVARPGTTESLTPRESLQLQVSRDFLGTLGYAEHEQIAKQILTHLSVENDWKGWLLKSDYDTEDGAHYGNWRRSKFLGASDWQMISFDVWVVFDEHDGNRFQVTQEFVGAMQFKGRIEGA